MKSNRKSKVLGYAALLLVVVLIFLLGAWGNDFNMQQFADRLLQALPFVGIAGLIIFLVLFGISNI